MSTRAAIIKHEPTGAFRGIYLHFDGYPDGAGRILNEHYHTEEHVNALIGLGGLSEIGPTPAGCVAYHRDKGERLEIKTGTDLERLAQGMEWDYLYLWDEDGGWQAFNRREFEQEMREWARWEAERAERAAGWDPNP